MKSIGNGLITASIIARFNRRVVGALGCQSNNHSLPLHLFLIEDVNESIARMLQKFSTLNINNKIEASNMLRLLFQQSRVALIMKLLVGGMYVKYE